MFRLLIVAAVVPSNVKAFGTFKNSVESERMPLRVDTETESSGLPVDVEEVDGLKGYCHQSTPSCKIMLGTHNSYHIKPDLGVMEALKALGLGDLAKELDYTHPTLADQFASGMTSFEIDVLADPDGSRYVAPGVMSLTGATLGMPAPLKGPLQSEPNGFDAAMATKGFKVLHIQDIDVQSRCYTLAECLTQLLALPRATTTYVMLEIKVDTPAFPAGAPITPTPSLAMTDALWTALEAEVAAGALASPPIKFLIDNKDNSAAYIAKGGKVLVPNIEGMSALPSGYSNTEVYAKCNDVTDAGNCALGKTVAQLVADDILVRSRADSFPTWNETRAKATLASGAQIIHTDYIDKLKKLMDVMNVCGENLGTQEHGSCKVPTPSPSPIPFP